jgi:hypothetical protein
MALIATRNQELFLAEQRHLHKSSPATSCCCGGALWLGAVSATAKYCGSAAAAAIQPQPYGPASILLEATVNITLLH